MSATRPVPLPPIHSTDTPAALGSSRADPHPRARSVPPAVGHAAGPGGSSVGTPTPKPPPLAKDPRQPQRAATATDAAPRTTMTTGSDEDELARLKALLQSQSTRLRSRAAGESNGLSSDASRPLTTQSPLPVTDMIVENRTSAWEASAAGSLLNTPSSSVELDSSGGKHSARQGKRKPPTHIASMAATTTMAANAKEEEGEDENKKRNDNHTAAHRAAAETVKRAGVYYVKPEARRAQGALLHQGNPESKADDNGMAAAAVGMASDSTPAATTSADVSEEQQLAAELELRQRRMEERVDGLRETWAHPPPSTGIIAPAEPRVLTAATDVEVHEKAAAAEEFANNQAKLKRRLDAQADRRAYQIAKHAVAAESEPRLVNGGDGITFTAPQDHDSWADEPASGDSSARSSVFGNFNFFSEATNSPSNHDHAPAHGSGVESLGGGGSTRPVSRKRGSRTGLHRGQHRFSVEPAPREPSGNFSHVNSRANPNERSMASLTLGRMSMASCSMARVTDGALAVMEMLANRPDVVLPSPSETSVVRTGDVLSAKHVLMLDLQDALRNRGGPTGMVSGAPYFRIVPKLNIAGVAQANISAIRTVVNELRRARIEGPIIWVNLREEPLVYINNEAHIVRERQNPYRPVIIPNVTGRSIEAIEAKLKEEVLQEAYENGGNISVHVEGKNGLVEDQWECADPCTVYTLKEVFQHLAVRSPPNAGALHYFRRPITQNIGPQPADFDFVLDACLEEPKAVFVFNCQAGRGRTSAMMQIANVVRFYQLCVKDVSVDVRVLRGSTNTPTFRTIQKLVSLFPDGKLHERRLNILMDLADKVYSMADHIIEAFSGMDENPEEAVMRLQQYALFLVFSYYCEQRLWNLAVKSSFTQWLTDNPDMRLLIYSVRDKLKDQLKAEQIITAAPPAALHGAVGAAAAANGASTGGSGNPSLNQGSVDPPEVAKVIRHRHGNVLSAGRILCSVPMGDGQATVRALRQLAPDVPIFTCGRMSGSARDELVRDIREVFPGGRKLHWMSLRAEPMVIINDVSYTLTDSNAPLNMTENGATMHVSVQAIEQIEDRLRRDVLLEAQEHGGYIILHHLDEQGSRSYLQVKVCSVRTPKSTMEDFVNNCDVSYYRVPIPFSGQMLSSDIDPLLRFLEESDADPHDIIVINDSEGTTRTSVALNMLVLHRAARLCDLRTIQTTADFVAILRVGESGRILPSAHLASSMPVEAEDVPEHSVEPLLASTICQMLTAGSLLRTVDAAIALSGRGMNYNILHKLDFLKKRISVVGVNKPQCILEAIHGLRSYLLVLLATLYLDDPLSVEMNFSGWVSEHTEVCNIIDNLEGRGEAALKYVASDNLMKADLSRRSGDVLTANFCLKADHFPGCQKKGLRPALCGAPNFRKVNLLNVYGVAIPTQLGIHNVLSILGALNEPLATYPGQSNDVDLSLGFAAPRLFDPAFNAEELQRPLRGSVVWVNLREEPILYVGDRPFVFRDLATPYVNVELTGIQTDKIEIVENQLKVDVLNEAQQYGGKFLVHDEGTPGELVGQWEPASEDTVKTLREVYEGLVARGARCRMLRLPVTDEQSPDISDFDLLVTALLPRIAEHLDRRETLSFVFNCQMGRGRTTTGMVICCLLIGLVIPEYYDELHSTHNPLYLDHETDLWRGDYEVITQLKRVLTKGRPSKYKVDLVLEECSKMQNLRTAIESFAIAEKSPDNTEEARARAHHAGVHYLVRYFNLIVFAVYLEESYDRMRKRMRDTFVNWMQQHPELTALAATAALK